VVKKRSRAKKVSESGIGFSREGKKPFSFLEEGKELPFERGNSGRRMGGGRLVNRRKK